MKTSAIKYLFITFLFIFFSNHGAAAQEQIAVPLSRPGEPGKLKVSAVRGGIQVTGYDGNEVIIRYRGDNGEAEQEVTKDGLRRISSGSIGFEASENDNEVKIGGISPVRDVHFEISVPRNFSLSLSLVHGDEIIVENVDGEMEISHVNGEVSLVNVNGSAVINTVNGDISASFREINPDKPMAFSNVNGDIDVTLPANARVSPKMKTEWGDVYTDFDMEIDRSGQNKIEDSDTGVYKVSVNNWIYGKINGGGPEYLFKSLRGDIYIRKQ